MGRQTRNLLAWSAAPAAVLACLLTGASGALAQTAAPAPARLFAQAEMIKTRNHPVFIQVLKQLNKEKKQLSRDQYWHLRYLNAWQYAFEGNQEKARPLLRDVIRHSNNTPLETRASALLINILGRRNDYLQAYTLANSLIAKLPSVKDSRAKTEALREIIQMLGWAGQYDQALKYAQELQTEHTSGESLCPIYSYKLNVLADTTRLSSTDPELHKGIALCLGDKQIVYANTLRLDLASTLIREGRAQKAIALLHRIAPSIMRTKFQPHVASLNATLAQAYLSAGEAAAANKSALTALKVNKNSGFLWASQAAYKVLYRVAKKAGNDTAALSYYEKYVALRRSAASDTKSRAMAYQMVKQGVEAKKLRVEALTRKNRILQLHQALAQKAAETSRLYIALLVIVIILIGLWLYRLKHSQLRFRRMARHDGLTGVFSRQHFFDEAGRLLHRLRKDNASACLLLLDLDHFKRINDTYGHAVGDEVLKRSVLISRQELRTSDLFGRLGGEEFAILMPSCSRKQGVNIGERIRNILASTDMKLDSGATVTVSASFGLACSETSGYSTRQLFTDADAALYAAKRGGRNRLVVGHGDDSASTDLDGLSTRSKPLGD